MKKLKNLALIILAILLPLNIQAATISDPNYTIEDVYISSEIDILGSMHVREAIVVKGSLNGFRREIAYKNSSLPDWQAGAVDFADSAIYNARGVSLSKVSSFKIDAGDIDWDIFTKEFDIFEEVTTAYKGQSGIYTLSNTSDGIDISVYNPNDIGYIVYYFDYYINQAVVVHNDIAELYFTFFKLDSDDAKKVHIRVTTPGTSAKDVFRFWGHGTLSGEIKPIVTNPSATEDEYEYIGVQAELSEYTAGSAIDIRMTFDRSQMAAMENVLNNSKQDALSAIIEIETQLADEANRSRMIIKGIYYGVIVLGGFYLIGLIILWIYMYRKYDKEYDVGFDHKYYREFTGDYNVEVVDYLMKEDITTDAMNASIMNLIYKKNIAIEEIPNENKNITLILKSKDGVNATEEKLIKLLFETIGNGEKVTLKEVEKFSSNANTAEKFMTGYDSWKASAIKDAKAEEFFESHSAPRAMASLYFILGMIILALIIFFDIKIYPLFIAILLGSIAFFIYVLTFKKWTKKGREHYLKWNAFRNFLKDFGSLKDKEIPEIALWDKYLVYATVLGVAKEVQKAMKVKLTEMGVAETSINPATFYYRDFYMINAINHSISSAHTRSINTINAANARSSMSSGSGFGGGFSGGGGHAGGGGGGGGF